MVDPRVILIAAAIAGSIWVGGEVVQGTKAVIHGVKHAIVKVVHPHRHADEP